MPQPQTRYSTIVEQIRALVFTDTRQGLIRNASPEPPYCCGGLFQDLADFRMFFDYVGQLQSAVLELFCMEYAIVCRYDATQQATSFRSERPFFRARIVDSSMPQGFFGALSNNIIGSLEGNGRMYLNNTAEVRDLIRSHASDCEDETTEAHF